MAKNVDEYIDMTINEIDVRIAEANKFIEFLRRQRRQALEFKAGVSIYDWYYFVESRTGGAGHEIKRVGMDAEFTCSCPAGRAGRECWAVRGVKSSVDDYGRPLHNKFYTDGGRHNIGASTESWYRARLNNSQGGWSS